MVNYKLNTENDEDFILYYEHGTLFTKDEKDNTISKKALIVHTGDGDINYIDDTKENEISLLNTIKKQMIDSKLEIDLVKQGAFQCDIYRYLSYTTMIVSLVYALNSIREGKILASILTMVLACLSCKVWRYFAKAASYGYECLCDYKKNMFYLENMDLFDKADYNDEDILKGISKKQVIYLKSWMEYDSTVNPNTIEKLSIKDLKKIKNNITNNSL